MGWNQIQYREYGASGKGGTDTWNYRKNGKGMERKMGQEAVRGDPGGREVRKQRGLQGGGLRAWGCSIHGLWFLVSSAY